MSFLVDPTRAVLTAVLGSCLFAGCPASTEPDLDGGTQIVDAPSLDDAPLDAPDADRDGVPDARDCDPASATVGATGSRACTGVCGAGVETCTDGAWAECIPAADCTCATEGMRRLTSCGMCGQRSEECITGRWMSISTCIGEGECNLGDVETRRDRLCMTEQRLCGADCRYGSWTMTRPPGECEAGLRNCDPTSPTLPDFLCTDDCLIVDNPCCPVPMPTPPECF
jgi:hypothetical protein